MARTEEDNFKMLSEENTKENAEDFSDSPHAECDIIDEENNA